MGYCMTCVDDEFFIKNENKAGIFFPQQGTIQSVSGKNVLISGDWIYATKILEYEELE